MIVLTIPANSYPNLGAKEFTVKPKFITKPLDLVGITPIAIMSRDEVDHPDLEREVWNRLRATNFSLIQDIKHRSGF